MPEVGPTSCSGKRKRRKALGPAGDLEPLLGIMGTEVLRYFQNSSMLLAVYNGLAPPHRPTTPPPHHPTT